MNADNPAGTRAQQRPGRDTSPTSPAPSPDPDGPATAATTHALIGRQVAVTLGTDDGSPVVARGKLLAHNEWGEVVLQDDMGGLQFCWPNLAIALDHDPTAQGDWP